jgi:ADP-ribose pyrophosphatase YjhB (NUDIX family)
MTGPKTGRTQDGKAMHYSVGALIEKDGRYLLIDRMNPPFGHAGIAGHVDEGEKTITALVREVREESGLQVVSYESLFEEEVRHNACKSGVDIHYWNLYRCLTSGNVVHNHKETKSIGWYSELDLQRLELEPVWRYWFMKMNLL